jgi:hypothetical protein
MPGRRALDCAIAPSRRFGERSTGPVGSREAAASAFGDLGAATASDPSRLSGEKMLDA